MRDKFIFSDGQDLSTLDSTGVVSENIWDLEEDAVTDHQVVGWINFIVLATTNTGGDEGLDVELRTSDNTNMSTSPAYLGAHKLIQAEIAAGKAYSFGVCKAALKKYVALWFKAVSTSLDGATTVDAWFSEQPISVTGIQKKNTSTGAS